MTIERDLYWARHDVERMKRASIEQPLEDPEQQAQAIKVLDRLLRVVDHGDVGMREVAALRKQIDTLEAAKENVTSNYLIQAAIVDRVRAEVGLRNDAAKEALDHE